MSRLGSTKQQTTEFINITKKSFSEVKSTSLGTIFAITNSMVGSVCLIIP